MSGLTKVRRQRFLEILSETGNVSLAAEQVGCSKQHLYVTRKADPGFAQAWDEALRDAVDALQGALHQRAIEKDTQAAIFLLRHLRPEVFGDRREVTQGGGVFIYLPERAPLALGEPGDGGAALSGEASPLPALPAPVGPEWR